MFVINLKKETLIACLGVILILLSLLIFPFRNIYSAKSEGSAQTEEQKGETSDVKENNRAESKNKSFIKYVEFNPTFDVLERAMKEDIKSQNEDIKINWIEILAYLAAKYGGDFKQYKEKDLNQLIKCLKDNEKIEDKTKNMKLYTYYYEAYSAVLGEFMGNYKTQKNRNKDDGSIDWEEKYGLKVFSPIAKTFPFCHYDDFGASRSYGYSRPHLGHDLMSATGTPVIAVESGIVEVMGWNQYGGWRIGIRSFDKKRYYYYAHLRQNRPYHADLKEGKVIKAGDVIGYVGRTGYSSKENVSNITQSHLHLGLQLIFDESQKESNNEIWIDLYAITKLLEKNKSAVVRDSETKEYKREFGFYEPSLENK